MPSSYIEERTSFLCTEHQLHCQIFKSFRQGFILHNFQLTFQISQGDTTLWVCSLDRRIEYIQAITSLFSIPGNNFRIFLNGSLIFGGLGGGVDMTATRFREANEKIDALLKVSMGYDQLASQSFSQRLFRILRYWISFQLSRNWIILTQKGQFVYITTLSRSLPQFAKI